MSKATASLGVCLLAILFLSGCWVQSLNPMFEKESDIIFDPRLEGHWVASDGGASVTFSRDGGGKCYNVVYWEQGGGKFGPEHEETTNLYTCLGRLGKNTFLDVDAGDPKLTEALTAHLVDAHSFWRVELGPDTFSIRSLNSEWFKKQIESRKLGLAYVPEGNHLIVLTSSTPELRAFFQRHGDEIFGEKHEFHRQK